MNASGPFRTAASVAMIVILLGHSTAQAQQAHRIRPWAANVMVPQTFRSSTASQSPLTLSEVNVEIDIKDQMATTRMMISIANASDSQQMAEFVIPVPAGTVVRGFTFEGAATEPSSELMERDEARQLFESIVAKLRDPALLEFAGLNLVRTSVFPVPANGNQRVQLVMEQLLPNDNHRIDFLLPRSQSLAGGIPWKISARVRSSQDIATLYSPSHEIATRMVSAREATISVPDHAASNPGAFRLSYLQATGPMTASLMTYPHRDGQGGYFLLLAGLGQVAAEQPHDPQPVRREVILVLDRSGSMRGEKIEQAKAAALQVLQGLEEGEPFNIITFNDQIESFAKSAVAKSPQSMEQARQFIQSFDAQDGTNLHDALATALACDASAGCLPIVLFLTDGLPTVGNTSELAIRELAETQNPHQRRIFSFGVGFDVNTPLLDKMATSTRAFATFVTPGENVEVSVTRVFKGLAGPTLADVKMQVVDGSETGPSRIFDVLPGRLPDLYAGDQLVVLGRYRGNEPLKFEITGKRGESAKHFEFEFDLQKLPTRQPFVARLWASRRIANLIDQVRDLGAETQLVQNAAAQLNAAGGTLTSAVSIDPRLTELTESIIAISKEFGILTEYTSFLAEEGVDLSDEELIHAQAQQQLIERALQCRTGSGSWNQESNTQRMRGEACLNLDNRYLNASGQWVRTVAVQQCQANALYRRGDRWVDNRSLDVPADAAPDRVVEFGSPEFLKLLWSMVANNRQDEMALDGDILITVGDERVLVKGVSTDVPKPAADSPQGDVIK